MPAALTGGALAGPALIAQVWITPRQGEALSEVVAGRAWAYPREPEPTGNFPSLVVLTNAPLDSDGPVVKKAFDVSTQWQPDSVWLGCELLGDLIDRAPAVRRRVPSVLGVRELDPLLDGDARSRSSWDEVRP